MSCRRCEADQTNRDLCTECQTIEDLREQVTILKAERDEARILMGEVEQMLTLTKDDVKKAYVYGWVAGRAQDDRVPPPSPDVNLAMYVEALASFARWEEHQAKKAASVT